MQKVRGQQHWIKDGNTVTLSAECHANHDFYVISAERNVPRSKLVKRQLQWQTV